MKCEYCGKPNAVGVHHCDPEDLKFVMKKFSEALATAESAREKAEQERDEAVMSEEALSAKLDCLSPTCGCSYDKPGDLCAHHSPEVIRLRAELSSLKAEAMEFYNADGTVTMLPPEEVKKKRRECAEEISRLRTLFEREKAKNAKLMAVVEAARRVMRAEDSMRKCPGFDPEAGYRWDEVMQSLIEALSELEAGR